MTPTLRATILGCGSSGGVPRVGGDWGTCDPNEPRNHRLRCSLLLQRWNGPPGPHEAATTVLIDTSPDLRAQLLATRLRRVDALLYSHDHADQAHGIDDLRALVYAMRRRIKTYMDAPTRASLTHRFGYIFHGVDGYPPILEDAGILEPHAIVRVEGPGGPIELEPLLQDHGSIASLGFRVGPLAYSNDCVKIAEASFARLHNLELWIVDALRRAPHPTHSHLAQSLAWIERIKPRQTILTNLHTDMDYQTLCAELPQTVVPAYDFMVVDLPIEPHHFP